VACKKFAWHVALASQVRYRFDIKNQGDLSDIIGIHITRDSSARTISRYQGKHVRELLDKHDITDLSRQAYPLILGFSQLFQN
jgi:hypothetical protein